MPFAFQTTAIVLSVGILLSGFCTPAFQHAHAGGGRPHGHGAIHKHPGEVHSHGRGEHRHDGVDDDHLSQAPAIDNAVPHFHFSLLGFEFTLPAGGGATSLGRGASESTSLAFVVSCSDGIVATAPDDRLLTHVAASGADAMRPAEPLVLSACRYSVTPAASAPLCDAARHERSGVQLA